MNCWAILGRPCGTGREDFPKASLLPGSAKNRRCMRNNLCCSYLYLLLLGSEAANRAGTPRFRAGFREIPPGFPKNRADLGRNPPEVDRIPPCLPPSRAGFRANPPDLDGNRADFSGNQSESDSIQAGFSEIQPDGNGNRPEWNAMTRWQIPSPSLPEGRVPRVPVLSQRQSTLSPNSAME